MSTDTQEKKVWTADDMKFKYNKEHDLLLGYFGDTEMFIANILSGYFMFLSEIGGDRMKKGLADYISQLQDNQEDWDCSVYSSFEAMKKGINDLDGLSEDDLVDTTLDYLNEHAEEFLATGVTE